MTWHGNRQGRERLRAFLSSEPDRRSCFLTGPYSVGKRGFTVELAGGLLQEDALVVEPGVDGAREVAEFLATSPVCAEFRVAVVLGADRMQLPSQDAYLKVLEEPPPRSKIVFVVDDLGLMSPPLQSRARLVCAWRCLRDDEMRAFAEELGNLDGTVLQYCGGRPGVYATMRGDKRVDPLLDSVRMMVSGGRDLLVEQAPVILVDLDSKSPARVAVAHLIWRAAVACVGADPARMAGVMRYASVLASCPSVNAELGWFRMVVELSRCRS